MGCSTSSPTVAQDPTKIQPADTTQTPQVVYLQSLKFENPNYPTDGRQNTIHVGQPVTHFNQEAGAKNVLLDSRPEMVQINTPGVNLDNQAKTNYPQNPANPTDLRTAIYQSS